MNISCILTSKKLLTQYTSLNLVFLHSTLQNSLAFCTDSCSHTFLLPKGSCFLQYLFLTLLTLKRHHWHTLHSQLWLSQDFKAGHASRERGTTANISTYLTLTLTLPAHQRQDFRTLAFTLNSSKHSGFLHPRSHSLTRNTGQDIPA